jgi:hypothetical protein
MKLRSVFYVKLLPICVALILSSVNAMAQGFMWAQEIVSPGGVGPTVITCTTDENNNGYFVGCFNGTTDFDPGPGVQNLTAVGSLNMYILKKDAAGNFLWVKHIAGINANAALCFGYGIGLDNSGNIYVGGTYLEDFDFDPGPGVHQLSSFGGYHSFVLKLDPSGNFTWVKDMGNPTDVASMSMLCMQMDAGSNIYFGCSIVGSMTANTIDVDPGPAVYNIICPTSGGNDVLIEKLDSAGNFVWAKQISGDNDKDPLDLALDTLSNIYITGQYRGTADFDPGTGVANLSSPSNYDAFIAKYDSAGNYQWAAQINGAGNVVGNGIAADTFGNIVVTGQYATGGADFDPGPGVYSITSASMDMFVLKLRNDGSFVWANSVHPGGNDRGLDIATDGYGNVYTTGDFFTNADFDPGPGEYWLDGGTYVQKLDSAGNFAWAKAFPGEVSGDIVLDHANDIYVVGWFSASGDFDPGPEVFTLSGNGDGFIEKLCGTSLAITASDSTPCAGDNVQLTATVVTGATYTWTKNDTVIAGSGNTITISEPGVYEVYTDGGCPSASGPIYIIDCLGVGETMNAESVGVYPNPVNDNLAIETTLANYTLTVLNTLGQVVERRMESGKAVLNVSQYNSGIYYLQITTTEGQVMNRKFVVQH